MRLEQRAEKLVRLVRQVYAGLSNVPLYQAFLEELLAAAQDEALSRGDLEREPETAAVLG